ncbi:hypothetical protein B0H13DRAFT_770829 [Mycena leptocephala]|nr:hypothetical protein B0H13DRAFT_770829 [Mycena leptocephala]
MAEGPLSAGQGSSFGRAVRRKERAALGMGIFPVIPARLHGAWCDVHTTFSGTTDGLFVFLGCLFRPLHLHLCLLPCPPRSSLCAHALRGAHSSCLRFLWASVLVPRAMLGVGAFIREAGCVHARVCLGGHTCDSEPAGCSTRSLLVDLSSRS